MAAKTSIDAINKVYSILRSSPLYNAVGGKFFKGKKLDNFTDECVVIPSLPMTKGQIQVCRVMVNIFVPNLELNGDEPKTKDRSQPDYPRLSQLSAMLEAVMTEYEDGDVSIRIEDEEVIENEGFNEHYHHYRLVFRNINL